MSRSSLPCDDVVTLNIPTKWGSIPKKTFNLESSAVVPSSTSLPSDADGELESDAESECCFQLLRYEDARYAGTTADDMDTATCTLTATPTMTPSSPPTMTAPAQCPSSSPPPTETKSDTEEPTECPLVTEYKSVSERIVQIKRDIRRLSRKQNVAERAGCYNLTATIEHQIDEKKLEIVEAIAWGKALSSMDVGDITQYVAEQNVEVGDIQDYDEEMEELQLVLNLSATRSGGKVNSKRHPNRWESTRQYRKRKNRERRERARRARSSAV